MRLVNTIAYKLNGIVESLRVDVSWISARNISRSLKHPGGIDAKFTF